MTTITPAPRQDYKPTHISSRYPQVYHYESDDAIYCAMNLSTPDHDEPWIVSQYTGETFRRDVANGNLLAIKENAN